MEKVISIGKQIGKQNFASLRENHYFFVDKSHFIKDWWENGDEITLITRPRRFGKTLNMSMLNCFFSNKYAVRGDLFEGLGVWEEEKYRELQGTYPVIFLSFAAVKADQLSEAKIQIKQQIARVYEENRYLLDGDLLSGNEKKAYNEVNLHMGDAEAAAALNNMSTINEQISNFAQTYPTNLKASSNEALLFMRRYRFANCSCFSCCFKDAYPSSNVQ